MPSASSSDQPPPAWVIFAAVVVGTAASVCELPTGPRMACAPPSISLRITAGSLAGELSSSASMISIFLPSMPPAPLISSTAIFTPTYSGANDDATRPVMARAEPILIVSPACANTLRAPASSEPPVSAMPADSTLRRERPPSWRMAE